MFRQVVLSTTTKPKVSHHNFAPMVYRDDNASKIHLRDQSHLHPTDFRNRRSICRSISWDDIAESVSSEKLTVPGSTKNRSQSAKTATRIPENKRMQTEDQNMIEINQMEVERTATETKSCIRAIPRLQVEDHKKGIEVDALPETQTSNVIFEKLRLLIQAFAERAQRIKSKISKPIPEDELSGTPEEIDLSLQEPTTFYEEDWLKSKPERSFFSDIPRRFKQREIGVFDPQSYVYIVWLFFVSLAFLYNSYGILLRTVFPYQTSDSLPTFLALDYFCDAIYVVDIVLFKSRVRFTEEGQLIEDPKLTRKHYFRSSMFKYDCLSLLPLELFYVFFGANAFLRFPRLLKIPTFWEFFNRVDVVAKSPYAMRVIKTLIYMTFLIHLNASAYYAVSVYEGFDANEWVYNNTGNAYIRCFYFAFRTATSISGKMVKPTNNLEYIFMINSWLNGVFVFAFLIGQIRDIVATATQHKQQFRQIMNQTIRHMNNLNLPKDLQRRVRLWLNYTWEQQKLNDGQILNLLPIKMKTDIAMNVHFQMLSKVQLFKGCDWMVLRDLVVKLRPVLFLPGDYICRKGEIGQEMYIVNEGKVQVLDESEKVLATLSEGSVFGEVSVLGLPGCSRRMADVRSLGFSNLYMLSKVDLWDTLMNYPEAQNILRQKARKVMRERQGKKHSLDDEIDAESIIRPLERPTTPRLVSAVMQMVSPESKCAQYLNRNQSPYSARSPLRNSLSPSVGPFNSSVSSFDLNSSGSQGLLFLEERQSKSSVFTDSDEESRVDSNVIREIISKVSS